MPCTQANWSWDCLTPYTALTGRSVSVSAYVRLQKNASDRGSCESHVLHAQKYEFPQGLKPKLQSAANGTAEAVPLQIMNKRGLRGQASEPGSTD